MKQNQCQAKCIADNAAYRLLPVIFLLCLSLTGIAQFKGKADTACQQMDVFDIWREWRNKPPNPASTKTSSLLVIPSFGVNPTSGLMLGAGGQYVRRGNKPNSKYTYLQATLFVTTKKQLMFQFKNNVYAKDDRIFLSGDWRYFIFSQPTYGLSSRAPQGSVLDRHYNINGFNVHQDSLIQPMNFNNIRFYQTVSFRLKDWPLYAGVGYHLDRYSKIVDERLDTARGILPSHFSYSKAYGFNSRDYTVSGLSLNLVGDTRDNIVNARKGYFFSVNMRMNQKFLGSDRNSNQLNLEWRSFHGVDKMDDRKVMAFWLMGNFSKAGKLPYLALPALGYDQRGRAGRGYAQGRFRGPNMVYGEAEYRFPLSSCGGVLSGVIFANVTTADSPDKTVPLFSSFAPGGGAGLRIMVDKLSRSNLQVDFGIGRKSIGVYIGVAESF